MSKPQNPKSPVTDDIRDQAKLMVSEWELKAMQQADDPENRQEVGKSIRKNLNDYAKNVDKNDRNAFLLGAALVVEIEEWKKEGKKQDNNQSHSHSPNFSLSEQDKQTIKGLSGLNQIKDLQNNRDLNSANSTSSTRSNYSHQNLSSSAARNHNNSRGGRQD